VAALPQTDAANCGRGRGPYADGLLMCCAPFAYPRGGLMIFAADPRSCQPIHPSCAQSRSRMPRRPEATPPGGYAGGAVGEPRLSRPPGTTAVEDPDARGSRAAEGDTGDDRCGGGAPAHADPTRTASSSTSPARGIRCEFERLLLDKYLRRSGPLSLAWNKAARATIETLFPERKRWQLPPRASPRPGRNLIPY